MTLLSSLDVLQTCLFAQKGICFKSHPDKTGINQGRATSIKAEITRSVLHVQITSYIPLNRRFCLITKPLTTQIRGFSWLSCNGLFALCLEPRLYAFQGRTILHVCKHSSYVWKFLITLSGNEVHVLPDNKNSKNVFMILFTMTKKLKNKGKREAEIFEAKHLLVPLLLELILWIITGIIFDAVAVEN